jgi:oxygen-independent coproporphyrinogen-3 oxidase
MLDELEYRMRASAHDELPQGHSIAELSEVKHSPLQTLYFGGGTPSLLSMSELGSLTNGIRRWFDLDGVREFTLEVNPEDVTPAKIKDWRSLGVNRISLGIQSFDDRNLTGMNRAHNAAQGREALHLLQNEGFESISADLIYGYPDRTLQDFEADLQELLSWRLPHFSSYQLTVEPQTALYHQVNQKKVRLAAEDLVLEQMIQLYQVSAAQGYRAYEISNFALPGHEAVHNSRYWSGHAYWGLGPSAHSFDGHRKRSWNIANNIQYQMEIQSGKVPSSEELLTDDQRFNEAVLIGLRLMDGMHWLALEEAHGPQRVQRLRHQIAKMPEEWFEALKLEDREAPLRLSLAGRALADFIAVELFAEA